MANSYSPIDENSYRESGSFDPAALYNNIPVSEPARPEPRVAEPEPEPEPAPRQAEPQSQAYAAPAVPLSRPRRTRRLWQLIADSRTAYAFGIVLFFVAAYTFLVCISYFLNIPSDQSAMLNEDFDPTMIRNAGGPVGAWLAHLLVYQWLGLGAFVLIYFVVVCALGLVRVYRPSFWNLTLRTFLGSITISVVAGLLTYGVASPVYWGGYHGYLLNTNLITYTGIWGAIAVSLILLGFMAVLYLTEINRLWRRWRAAYAAYTERQAVR
ncbi:MAG: DNA translocase FtsK 4TM domain-containing protein, partial [Duncaniella sp.]|nr:DNA translocase FtsK 4TM domain-containing protein [Duncaniella sp.]